MSVPIEVVYNAFYFSFYAGYAPFVMFRPVFFKYIGLSPSYVGLLCGLRFVLQAAATPILLLIAERFSARKLTFVISYIVLMAKLLIILVALRPEHQKCVINHIKDENTQKIFIIHHVLFKRDLTETWNETDKDVQILGNVHLAANKTLFENKTPIVNTENQTEHLATAKFKKTRNETHSLVPPTEISPKIRNQSSNNSKNSENVRVGLPTTPKSGIAEHIIYNDRSEIFRIFTCLLVLVILSDSFDAAMFSLVEDSCSATLDEYHYGQAQTSGTVGWGIIVPSVGIIIYYFNREFCGMYVGSFHYVFYFAFGFISLAFLCGMCMNFPAATKDVLNKVVQGPSSNFQYAMFTFVSSYSGFCNGFLLSFTYWFIDSLGGSAVVMGLTTGCRAVVSIIVGLVLKSMIGYVGHQIIIHVGLVCHIVVFVMYFLIKLPLLVLGVEVFNAAVHILTARTCSSFLTMKAPTGSSPKLQGEGIYMYNYSIRYV